MEIKNFKKTKITGNDLTERLLDFAVELIKLIKTLPKSGMGNFVGGQLMRSGTSPGAIYEEACGAESRADFIHKMGLVLKELKESRFWLRLIQRAEIMKSKQVDSLTRECQELCAIIAKSIITARKNR
jgi:four helix bundle protein